MRHPKVYRESYSSEIFIQVPYGKRTSKLATDNRHAAVCATRPSENAFLLVESYKFVSQAFLKIQMRNFFQKNLRNRNLFTFDEDTEILRRLYNEVLKIRPQLCSKHYCVVVFNVHARYKKNLKALYLVHPTRFIKAIWNIFRPFIRYCQLQPACLSYSDIKMGLIGLVLCLTVM